jgi:hypothetical protein
MTARLNATQELNVDDQLIPDNNTTHLVMQGDGNLVLYRNDNGTALWASNTWAKPVTHAIMQGDGNFVCYDDKGIAYWATGTSGHPGSYVILQDDGNLVVYGPNGGPLWASNTVQNWDPFIADTEDESVAPAEWMHSWASVASNGLIFGHTHTWCNYDLKGFHGSVLPVLLDGENPPKVIWPPDPDQQKHTYGVDGVWIGTHDRTDYWSNQVDPATLANAKALHLIDYLDPHNQLLNDIGIVGKALSELIQYFKAAFG